MEAEAGSATEPAKPTNLQAFDVSPTQIDLYWVTPDEGGSPITGYKIEVKTPSSSYSTLVSNTGNSTTKYSHTSLSTGTTYIYRIYAINAIGESEKSSEATATPTSSSVPLENIAPNSPSSLTALDISPTSIKLTWIKPSENNGPPVIGYKIEVQVESGTFSTHIANTGTTATTYTHTGLTTDTKYSYRVSAVNTVGTSTVSNISFATPKSTSAEPTENIPPNAPRTLKAIPGSPTSIILSWKEPSSYNGPAVTGYEIEYKTSGNYTKLPAIGPGKSFVHEDLIEETQYTYRAYAINSIGPSSPSNTATATPEHTLVPTNLVADDISPTQILLTWNAPSQTFGAPINGYEIREQFSPGVYNTVKSTNDKKTVYTVTGLTTDKEYTFVVEARTSYGTTSPSNSATATPTSGSKPPSQFTLSGPPTNLVATAVSPIQIDLSWNYPSSDGGSPVTGYRIDVKVENGNYVILESNAGSSRSYSHTQRTTDTEYSYKVYAINSIGTSGPSNEASAIPTVDTTEPTPKKTPGAPISFQATVVSQTQINLSWSPPTDDGGEPITGYKIDVKENTGSYKILSSNVGKSTSYSHTGLKLDTNYQYRIFAINSIGTGTSSAQTSAMIQEEEPETKTPDFIDPVKGAQYYLDRYNNEAAYKAWFDSNFPDYTIEEAIELAIPGTFSESEEKPVLPFVDTTIDPQYYIDRYNNEAAYKAWFDSNFPDYTIEEAVGLKLEPIEEPEEKPIGVCGPGTVLVGDSCEAEPRSGGGCLIATATYGSELSPQVQQLRELRDNTLLQTESGSTFMTGFNSFYYLFSPTIADWERQNPVFKETVKVTLTPLITSLSILNYVNIDSEAEVLGYGVSLIILNVGMYIAAPVGIGLFVFRRSKNS